MRKIGIGLVGPGFIGSKFIEQISSQASALERKYALHLQLNGVLNSKRMLVATDGMNPSTWRDVFDSQAEAADLNGFYQRLMQVPECHHVIVDTTASELVPDYYPEWLAGGCHIITPNKKMGAGPWKRYLAAMDATSKAGSHFYYESTVGAGLPVISSLQSLLDTGDKIKRIDGVFSGTLSYIFNSLSGDKLFSQIVCEAKELGFTEPDPREDLAGLDVARKVIVLARECGMEISLDDLQVETLVPDELKDVESVDAFLSKLAQFDDAKLAQAKSAESEGATLQYVGIIDVENGRCEVGLKKYPKDHALSQLSGTDNMICFSTERYTPLPLIVRGPGAGASVTAMGIFSDLVTLAKRLPPSIQ